MDVFSTELGIRLSFVKTSEFLVPCICLRLLSPYSCRCMSPYCAVCLTCDSFLSFGIAGNIATCLLKLTDRQQFLSLIMACLCVSFVCLVLLPTLSSAAHTTAVILSHFPHLLIFALLQSRDPTPDLLTSSLNSSCKFCSVCCFVSAAERHTVCCTVVVSYI
jgi:hypothetical protein